jgi:hypothetical protein
MAPLDPNILIFKAPSETAQGLKQKPATLAQPHEDGRRGFFTD